VNLFLFMQALSYIARCFGAVYSLSPDHASLLSAASKEGLAAEGIGGSRKWLYNPLPLLGALSFVTYCTAIPILQL
jgi:hypothetical protein